ncbi:translation initiation factor IF-2 associated domain-containing protein, partial [Sphingomonas solaris]
MSDNDKPKLGMRAPLGLKRTVETGKVKQSFSHGRSNTVIVETKRRRVLTKPGEAEAPVAEAPAPVAVEAPAPVAAPAPAAAPAPVAPPAPVAAAEPVAPPAPVAAPAPVAETPAPVTPPAPAPAPPVAAASAPTPSAPVATAPAPAPVRAPTPAAPPRPAPPRAQQRPVPTRTLSPLSLINISQPTRHLRVSYSGFFLQKKNSATYNCTFSRPWHAAPPAPSSATPPLKPSLLYTSPCPLYP